MVHAGGLSEDRLSGLIDRHRQALASREGVLKDDRRTAVTRVHLDEEVLCVKEYRAVGLRDRVKDCLRASRAERAWRAAGYLASCGVATPEPVALIEGAGRGHLVTRFVEEAVPLDRLLRERFAGPLSPSELAAKRTLLGRLGRWLRRVHDLGVYHDDWSAKNILVVERGGQWAFHLLDWESIVPHKRLTYRRRVKNLGQLGDAPSAITRTDRMRFLLGYAGGEASLTRGRFPRGVLAYTRRRVERRVRRQARAAKRMAGAPPRGPLNTGRGSSPPRSPRASGRSAGAGRW